MNKKAISFEIKQLGDDGSFVGLASVYGNVDRHNDIVANGSFTRTVQQNGEVPILWQHDPTQPIGLGTLRDSVDGLIIEGQLNLDVARAKEAYSLLKQRAVKGLSIGYDPLQWRWDGDIRVLEEMRLWEVSIVTFPANENAVVTRVKSTGYQALPVVNTSWSAEEALQRVEAWAGDDANKKATAFLVKGEDGKLDLLIADVEDNKLVLNANALKSAADVVVRGDYPAEVKKTLEKYLEEAKLNTPFKKEANFERVMRKIVASAYLTQGEVKTGRTLSAENIKLLGDAVDSLTALQKLVVPAAPNAGESGTGDEPDESKNAPAPENDKPEGEPDGSTPSDDSDQRLHSLLADIQSFLSGRQ